MVRNVVEHCYGVKDVSLFHCVWISVNRNGSTQFLLIYCVKSFSNRSKVGNPFSIDQIIDQTAIQLRAVIYLRTSCMQEGGIKGKVDREVHGIIGTL